MFLLGATAIEDKLQDGVPDAIHTMQMAGIKVGMTAGRWSVWAWCIGINAPCCRSGCLLVTDKRRRSISVFRVD